MAPKKTAKPRDAEDLLSAEQLASIKEHERLQELALDNGVSLIGLARSGLSWPCRKGASGRC